MVDVNSSKNRIYDFDELYAVLKIVSDPNNATLETFEIVNVSHNVLQKVTPKLQFFENFYTKIEAQYG